MADYTADEAPVPEIDTSKPHPARIYDYGLGGKNHFAADREVGDKVLASLPTVRTTARENRAFLGRTVRYLAEEAGIRQFLDIGTGLPTTNNVHEVAQAVAPTSRVVYVDNATPWSSRTPRRCSPARPKAAPPTSMPTSATRRLS
jgi:hypothetical protein